MFNTNNVKHYMSIILNGLLTNKYLFKLFYIKYHSYYLAY